MIDTNEKIKNIWGQCSFLEGLMNEKIEFSRKQEEKNLVITQMLKSLEEAALNSKDEILELVLLENKLVNNLAINNSIQSSLNNLHKYGHDEPSVSFFINQSLRCNKPFPGINILSWAAAYFTIFRKTIKNF